MKRNISICLIALCALAIGSLNARVALGAEKVQKFNGVEIAQLSDPGCVGLRVKYTGKLSSEKKLQAYVDVNGAKDFFDMERDENGHRLVLTSCPISCQERKAIQKPCTDKPNQMRKVFYWAMANGRPAPWFVELAFIGGSAGQRDDNHHDNFRFYFP